ncbi:MAG: hypothetical protein Q9219_003341 [cf. Caloplaca sp. 3 TL-2023]
MTVPPHLILSLENVWILAKSDRDLKSVLDAVGEYSQTARGAILIFLLLQITHGAVSKPDKVGVSSPLTEYVKFLPDAPLPTFWSDKEKALLTGTSLKAAIDSKLRSLDREFTHLRDCTSSIGWCQKHWWNVNSGALTFEHWKQVDAMYRSRALDLPGTGHAMVPCIDMANHASGDDTVALYDTDADGNATLVLREGKTLQVDDEITITYGDEKGACEMLFSYGFLEDTVTSARELFLDLDIPTDDPLRSAKEAVSKAPPGFKIFEKERSIDWEGDFIWLICVNEEDGLGFRLLQPVAGENELEMSWKEQNLIDVSRLRELLEKDPHWEIFRLRAIVILQERAEKQLLALERSENDDSIMRRDSNLNNSSFQSILRLRKLEKQLMLQAYQAFEDTVSYPSDVYKDSCFLRCERLTFREEK